MYSVFLSAFSKYPKSHFHLKVLIEQVFNLALAFRKFYSSKRVVDQSFLLLFYRIERIIKL